jgi:hypothetical protein
MIRQFRFLLFRLFLRGSWSRRYGRVLVLVRPAATKDKYKYLYVQGVAPSLVSFRSITSSVLESTPAAKFAYVAQLLRGGEHVKNVQVQVKLLRTYYKTITGKPKRIGIVASS